MNWDEDDELTKQWEEVGGVWQCQALQQVPELVASQRISKGKEVEGKGEGRKVVGWSTKEMDAKGSILLVKGSGAEPSERTCRSGQVRDS